MPLGSHFSSNKDKINNPNPFSEAAICRRGFDHIKSRSSALNWGGYRSKEEQLAIGRLHATNASGKTILI